MLIALAILATALSNPLETTIAIIALARFVLTFGDPIGGSSADAVRRFPGQAANAARNRPGVIPISR